MTPCLLEISTSLIELQTRELTPFNYEIIRPDFASKEVLSKSFFETKKF